MQLIKSNNKWSYHYNINLIYPNKLNNQEKNNKNMNKL